MPILLLLIAAFLSLIFYRSYKSAEDKSTGENYFFELWGLKIKTIWYQMLGYVKERWKKLLGYISVFIIGPGLLFILVETVKAKNTGFETKTLWDWMELLVIPLVLAIGAFYLNGSERAVEREIAEDRQREAALQAYFDRMAELLLKENLRTTEGEEVRNVARTRTLSVLRVLDAKRNDMVFQFLYEAGLINSSEPIVNLEGADLNGTHLRRVDFHQANLSGANLRNADLRNAILSGANLSRAHLSGADLTSALMEGANLNYAWFTEANLRGAYLLNANLTGAFLHKANLERADLRNALVTDEQLKVTKKRPTMPDGTKHE